MRTLIVFIARTVLALTLLAQVAFSVGAIMISMPSFTPCGPSEGVDFCHNDWQAIDVEIIVACLAGIASNVIPWYYAERWLKRNPEAFKRHGNAPVMRKPLPWWVVVGGRSTLALAIGVFLVQPIIITIVGQQTTPICPAVYGTSDYPIQACASSVGGEQEVIENEMVLLATVLAGWFVGERQMRRRGLIKSQGELPSPEQS